MIVMLPVEEGPIFEDDVDLARASLLSSFCRNVDRRNKTITCRHGWLRAVVSLFGLVWFVRSFGLFRKTVATVQIWRRLSALRL